MARRYGPGVYVWRTRKPAARFNIPFFSRHFAYVGETTSLAHRTRQHLGKALPGDEFPQNGKPWTDLSPKLVLFIPLVRWKWVLRSVETIVILLTWPVYNHKKNQWNPRRIPLHVAERQRQVRDARSRMGKARRSRNFRLAHVYGIVAFSVTVFTVVSVMLQGGK